MENKDKILLATIASIEKRHGKGSVMVLDQKEVVDVDVISSGSLGIDTAVGIGGLPRGRIVEIYGQESSGKTTIALQAIAEAQKAGGKCAFVDVEHALDVGYASRIGVNCKDLIISQPDTAESALDIMETLVRSTAIDVLVLDSVAALVPRAELEGDMGDSLPGLQARLMSQALRKLTSAISRTNTLVIFINQIRMKIGVMFGSPETTTGGNALKFFASLRLEVRKIGNIKDKEDHLGSRVKVKVVKNKLSPPFKTVEFDILFGKGINRDGEIVDLACELGIIQKSGSWLSYGDHKLGQGKDNARQMLNDNPKMKEEIKSRILTRGLPVEESKTSNEESESDNLSDTSAVLG